MKEKPLKGELAIDPKGLIFESYRIDGISGEECRTIFLDWVLGIPADADMRNCLVEVLDEYGGRNPDHPMTKLVKDGLQGLEARVLVVVRGRDHVRRIELNGVFQLGPWNPGSANALCISKPGLNDCKFTRRRS